MDFVVLLCLDATCSLILIRVTQLRKGKKSQPESRREQQKKAKRERAATRNRSSGDMCGVDAYQNFSFGQQKESSPRKRTVAITMRRCVDSRSHLATSGANR